MTRQIFLDTETTGLEAAQGHRIIEIACVEMLGRRLTKRNFHRYINPDRDIDPGAQQVHGISLEFLADKPRFGDVVDEFLDYVGDAELVIHNAAFDVGFLNAELKLVARGPIEVIAEGKRSIIDTWKMAREQFPGKKNSLNALCERFDVDNSARTLHGALLDAELLADVYLALTRGQDSLDIGLAASGGGGGGSGGGGGGRGREKNSTAAARPASIRLLRADAQELAAHAKVVDGLQKASGGKAIWSALATDSQDA